MDQPVPAEGLILGDLIDDFVRRLIDFDVSIVQVISGRAAPTLIHCSPRSACPEVDVDLYLDGAYVLDPTYKIHIERLKDGFFTSDELTGSRHFPRAMSRVGSYHPLFSLETGGVSDHVAFVHSTQERSVVYSLLQLGQSNRFHGEQIQALQDNEKYILHLLSRFQKMFDDQMAADRSKSGVSWSIENLLTEELAPRQRGVVGLYLQGLSLDEIGSQLNISPNTARAHLQAAYRRLGVRNRGEVFAIILEKMGLTKSSKTMRASDLRNQENAQGAT